MTTMLTLSRYLHACYPNESDAVDYLLSRRSRNDIRASLHRGGLLLPCECSCGCCEYATARDEVDLCSECAEYAVDHETGEVVCSRDDRYQDDGEWTGGGMHGIGSMGWVSRPTIREAL